MACPSIASEDVRMVIQKSFWSLESGAIETCAARRRALSDSFLDTGASDSSTIADDLESLHSSTCTSIMDGPSVLCNESMSWVASDNEDPLDALDVESNGVVCLEDIDSADDAAAGSATAHVPPGIWNVSMATTPACCPVPMQLWQVQCAEQRQDTSSGRRRRRGTRGGRNRRCREADESQQDIELNVQS